MQRRLAQLPLHTGKAPPWLFARMAKLAGLVTMAVVDSYGPGEMLRRLSDPWWFQAFGCVLGFDWHSSGVTTVTCGAMKEAARLYGDDLGIFVAGGKGATSRKTPDEIAKVADRLGLTEGEQLIYASRMSAKVDSAAVQDGYQVYHHSFFFAPQKGLSSSAESAEQRGTDPLDRQAPDVGPQAVEGVSPHSVPQTPRNGDRPPISWCVVQQGMNETAGWARRYHWLGETVQDFVCEPHNAISNLQEGTRGRRAMPLLAESDLPLLNMVAAEAQANRHASAELVREHPDKLLHELERMTSGPTLFAPEHHTVKLTDVNAARLAKVLRLAHEQHPRDFETLLGTAQVGPATVRSLSLLAEVIYNAPASHRDPTQPPEAQVDSDTRNGRRWADYAYAHGGKDGTPFPVDRATYDRNLTILEDAVRKARLGETDKTEALRRLSRMTG